MRAAVRFLVRQSTGQSCHSCIHASTILFVSEAIYAEHAQEGTHAAAETIDETGRQRAHRGQRTHMAATLGHPGRHLIRTPNCDPPHGHRTRRQRADGLVFAGGRRALRTRRPARRSARHPGAAGVSRDSPQQQHRAADSAKASRLEGAGHARMEVCRTVALFHAKASHCGAWRWVGR